MHWTNNSVNFRHSNTFVGCNGTISESSEPESDPNKSLVDDIAAATKSNGDHNGPTSSTGVVDDRSITSRSESLESDIFEEAPPGTPIGMKTYHSRKWMDESMKSFRLPISRNRQESTSLVRHGGKLTILPHLRFIISLKYVQSYFCIDLSGFEVALQRLHG